MQPERYIRVFGRVRSGLVQWDLIEGMKERFRKKYPDRENERREKGDL